MGKAKPFDIPKREVWEAFKRVRANQGAAGVDAQSIAEFEVAPVRRVDVAKLSAHSVREVRGRCHLSLQERRTGAGAMECVTGSLCGLQAGAASREDEDRLLQGCEPPW